MEVKPRDFGQKLSITGAEPASLAQFSQTVIAEEPDRGRTSRAGPKNGRRDDLPDFQIGNRTSGGNTMKTCIFKLPKIDKLTPADIILTLHHGCLLPVILKVL